MLPFHAPVEHPPPDKPPVHSPHHLPPRGSRSCMLQATPSTIPCPPWTPDCAAATTPTHTHHRTGNSSPILNIPISASPSHTIPVLPHLFHLRSPHPPSATTTPRSSTFPTRLSPTATRTNGLCNPPINVSPPSFFRPSESLIEFLIAAQQIPAPYVDRGESLFPIQYTRACSQDCISRPLALQAICPRSRPRLAMFRPSTRLTAMARITATCKTPHSLISIITHSAAS